MAKAGKLDDALDLLSSLEKQCRTGADTHSNGRVLVLVVRLCSEVSYYLFQNSSIINSILFLP